MTPTELRAHGCPICIQELELHVQVNRLIDLSIQLDKSISELNNIVTCLEGRVL